MVAVVDGRRRRRPVYVRYFMYYSFRRLMRYFIFGGRRSKRKRWSLICEHFIVGISINMVAHERPSDRVNIGTNLPWKLWTMVSYFWTKKRAYPDTLTCVPWPCPPIPARRHRQHHFLHFMFYYFYSYYVQSNCRWLLLPAAALSPTPWNFKITTAFLLKTAANNLIFCAME